MSSHHHVDCLWHVDQNTTLGILQICSNELLTIFVTRVNEAEKSRPNYEDKSEVENENIVGYTNSNPTWGVLGQHHQISWNGCRAGSTRIQGQVRWDWWGDCDWIQSGMVRGWLVEIGASHQIWWNILREHNWGVPSAHIMFIYYVTYILECLIVLWGCMHTGTYTIL